MSVPKTQTGKVTVSTTNTYTIANDLKILIPSHATAIITATAWRTGTKQVNGIKIYAGNSLDANDTNLVAVTEPGVSGQLGISANCTVKNGNGESSIYAYVGIKSDAGNIDLTVSYILIS